MYRFFVYILWFFSQCFTFASENSADFTELNKIPLNQTQFISISTYDDSNQVVHPSIIIKNGKFLLAITPFPNSDPSYENPSFYTSIDGIHFTTPEGVTNPLVSEPLNGYNDDPDLIYDKRTDQYYIYYNETPYDPETKIHTSQYLNILKSSDTFDWVNSRLQLFDFENGDPFILSPSIIIDKERYNMFHVALDYTHFNDCQGDIHQNHIKVLHSPDGLIWEPVTSTNIFIDFPSKFNPWHLDILKDDRQFYMLITAYIGYTCSNRKLYLATSKDLKNWKFYKEPIIEGSSSLYNSSIIYKSTALIDGDNIFIYFSFRNNQHQWYLAVKHMSIQEITGFNNFLVPIINYVLLD